MSDNIEDVVNDSICVDKVYIPRNNEVHVGLAPINESVTKDASLNKKDDKNSNKNVENKKVVLKS